MSYIPTDTKPAPTSLEIACRNYRETEQAAKKALSAYPTGLRFHTPKGRLRTRRAVLKSVAKLVTENPPTRAWFQRAVNENGIDYFTTGDMLGEVLWQVKQTEEIDNEDGEFTELSRDKFLGTEITRLLAK